MKTSDERLYEAMFLVDSAGETEGDGASSAAKAILEKAGAEIVSMKKWDERKLTYKIAGRDRGTYILCYFHADGQKIRQIERDAQLSEKIMRVLILAATGGEPSGDAAGRPDDVSSKEGIEKGVASQPAAAALKDESGESKPARIRRAEGKGHGTEDTGEEITP